MARLKAEEQAMRNRALVHDKARGLTWATLAERYDVTPRRAQQIVDDWYETQDIEEPTAQDELRDEITLLDTIIEDCSTLALETKNDAVHLGALKLKLATQVKRLDLKRATGRLPSQLQNVALLAVVDRWTDAFDIMWHKLELQLEEPVFAEFERGVREIIHEDPSVVRARERRERAKKKFEAAEERRASQAERRRAMNAHLRDLQQQRSGEPATGG